MRSAVSRSVSRIAIAAALLLAFQGAGVARETTPAQAISRGPAGDYPMVLGAPFTVDGVTYTPVDVMNYDSVGYAQVGEGAGVSGAHRTLPLPSYVEVTSLETGRTILVRLTQRGPMTGSDLVSLSTGAWAQLGATPGARLPVRVRRVNPPEAERTLLRSGGQAPARMDTPPGLLVALKRKLGIAVVPPVVSEVATPAPAKVEPKPVAKAESKPVAKPVAKPAASPKPAEPVKAPATASSKALYVQVGAYSTRARAEASAKAVGGTVTASGKLWRVRVGPLKDRGQADAALAKVRAGGYADARVVTAP